QARKNLGTGRQCGKLLLGILFCTTPTSTLWLSVRPTTLQYRRQTHSSTTSKMVGVRKASASMFPCGGLKFPLPRRTFLERCGKKHFGTKDLFKGMENDLKRDISSRSLRCSGLP